MNDPKYTPEGCADDIRRCWQMLAAFLIWPIAPETATNLFSAVDRGSGR